NILTHLRSRVAPSILLRFIGVLRDEAATRCFVRNGPSEIDFYLDDLAIAYGQNLSVTEIVTLGALSFVSDEDSIAVSNKIDVVKLLEPGAVGPTTIKISCPVDSVI